MTRTSHSSFLCDLAVGFVSVALSAFAMTPVALAQRGAGGARVGGGGGHFSTSYFGGGRVAPSPAAATRHSPHIVRAFHGSIAHYGAGWTFRGRSSRPYWRNQGRLQNSTPAFTSPFTYFGNGFFSYGSGFRGAGGWPWWGGWGWGGWDDDWDSSWSPECDWESNCQNGPGHSQGEPQAGQPESGGDVEYDQPDVSRPPILVYLRDGTGFGALDYWLTNGTFHIETTYGTEKSLPLSDIDMQRTVAENAARGVTFTVTPYPMSSDPGSMFAPDSYAPDCPASSQPPFSQPAQPTSSVPAPAAGSTSSASWFGASGTASDRGFSVTSVRPDSPASEIGVRAGDIVVRVNCQRIRTAQDIDSAANASTGPVWVSFMIRGAWLTDKKVLR